MTTLIWTLNIIGWPIIHILFAKIAISLPASYFANDNFILRRRSWEKDGELYKKWFRIRRWKSFLPDGAPWLGGFTKKHFESRESTYIQTFLLETRRAEMAHWCMLFCLPIFFIWNPPWARWVMTIYAVAANFPCILAQRYNRLVIGRLQRR